MEYNEPVKKEDENKNWFSYISEKSEEVYKIFKAITNYWVYVVLYINVFV